MRLIAHGAQEGIGGWFLRFLRGRAQEVRAVVAGQQGYCALRFLRASRLQRLPDGRPPVSILSYTYAPSLVSFSTSAFRASALRWRLNTAEISLSLEPGRASLIDRTTQLVKLGITRGWVERELG